MGFYRDRDEIDEANGFGRTVDGTDPFAWVYGYSDAIEQQILKNGRHEPIIKTNKEEA